MPSAENTDVWNVLELETGERERRKREMRVGCVNLSSVLDHGVQARKGGISEGFSVGVRWWERGLLDPLRVNFSSPTWQIDLLKKLGHLFCKMSCLLNLFTSLGVNLLLCPLYLP